MPTNIFRGAKVLKKIKKVNSTHPDYASLVDPLFACGGKRVKTKKYLSLTQYTLY